MDLELEDRMGESLTTTSSTISQELAHWVSRLRAADLPADVVDDARWRLVDMVGVCVAGSRVDSAGPISRVAGSLGGNPQATTIAFGQKLPAPLAAWVNGAVGHGPDYDDTHGLAAVHISTVAIPAALAAAEARGASGEDCLLAFVAGAEISLRIAMGAPPHQFHKRGLHGTGVAGPFAAAAIASRLFGLTEEQIANALGMAGSQSSGLMQTLIDGSWVKRLHPGWGAQAGLTAALLAAEGFTGPAEVLEGKYGFFNALLAKDQDSFQLDRITDRLGSEWQLPDTTYKPWPNGAWNHSSMDAVSMLMEGHGIAKEQVERIDLFVPDICIPIVCEPREAKLNPRSPYHMKFSLPYAVAMLVERGTVEVDDFVPAVLAEPGPREFAKKVFCYADSSMPPDRFPARVELHTRDGRKLVQDMPSQKGGPGNRMRPEDHRRKFLGNARPTLGEERAAKLLTALENAWSAPDVRPIMALTVAEARS
jgi:2-methylcitrate dehydratase PrpD